MKAEGVDRVLRGLFGPKNDEKKESEENILKSLCIWICH